ncbi:MAG: flavin reductase [Oscillospiraceae bacterium]
MNTNAFRALSYGLYIVTAMDGDRPVGCTANSAMQITSDPATIALSINHDNYTNGCIAKSGKFAISIIGEKSDSTLIGGFGFKSSKDTDKFEKVSHEFKDGVPVITDCCAYIVCKVINKMETATHTVFLGEVIDADVLSQKDPMTYAYYHRVIKGTSPKNAPTYIKEEKTMPESKNDTKYVCSICGYVYDGEIPFEELPDDYVCPICGQPKSVFNAE